MNENLNDLLSEYEGTVQPEIAEDVVIEDSINPGIIATEENEVIENNNIELFTISNDKISLISFPDWIDKYYNHQVFSPDGGIRCPRTSLTGVDSRENLLFTVPHPFGETDTNGAVKREIRIIYGTLSMSIPDLPPEMVNIYKNNSAYILNKYDDNNYIKTYVLKTGSILSYCYKHDDILIPYNIKKIRQKDKLNEIEVLNVNHENIISRFSSDLENMDYESIILLYRQIAKTSLTFTTRNEILKWFFDKEKEVEDINHLIKINMIMRYIMDGKLD